jgi:hypothetical protein
MVALIEKIKERFALSYRRIIDDANISYATFMRWKGRITNGKPPLESPGPKKIASIDLEDLTQKIDNLDHGKKRSRGTGALHGVFKNAVSRRELNAMIDQVRRDRNRQRRASASRVVWHHPDVVWGLDGYEYTVGADEKMHVQNLQDLCSRYKFPPLATEYPPCGEEVSGHLDHHFTRFGPPLFIKRDNGGNLNHEAINQVLEESFVIPINSPVNTPAYNGAIENSQGEIKAYLDKWFSKAESMEEFFLLAETATHDLNHETRRSLNGKNACQIYFNGNRIRFSRRKRKAVYDWIRDLAIYISEKAGNNMITPLAWRIAAKKWLEENKLMTIVKPEKVLPHFL